MVKEKALEVKDKVVKAAGKIKESVSPHATAAN